MTTAKKVHDLYTSPIDRLGEIRAQMADLKKVEQSLVSEIQQMGPGSYEGEMFRVSISEIAETSSPDPKAMETKLREMGVDNRWFSRNMKTRAGYVVVRTSARKS